VAVDRSLLTREVCEGVSLSIFFRSRSCGKGDDALSALVAEGRAEDGTEPVGEAHAVSHGRNGDGECLDGAGGFLNCHESILAEIRRNCKLYFLFFTFFSYASSSAIFSFAVSLLDFRALSLAMHLAMQSARMRLVSLVR